MIEYKHKQLTKAVDWEPFPKQRAVLERSEDLVLTGGSRGGAKTECGFAFGCNPAWIGHPRFRGLVLRNSTEDLADWIFRARIFYEGLGEIVGRPPVIRWKAGGETVLGHWKGKETLRKWIGQEFHHINVEELTQTISTFEEFVLLLGSLRSSIKELIPQGFMSTNPGGAGHAWTKKFFVDRAEYKTVIDEKTKKSIIFIPSTVDDNPAIMQNDPGYVQFLDGLPEPLRSAWRDGDWDCFEGQFFTGFGAHLGEPCFEISPSDAAGRLYGSLDMGTAHGTSFGLWFLDRSNNAHRLFTYFGKSDSHSEHAGEIKSRILSFRYTGGMFPVTIVYCRSGNEVKKDSVGGIWRPIDEYIKAFKGQVTRFQLAFDEKRLGCGLMHEAFKNRDGVSFVRYWKEYNSSFEQAILSAIHDDNDKEIYKKTADDGDDLRDEARYGIVHLYSITNIGLQRKEALCENSVIPFNNDRYMEENYDFTDQGYSLG